ncbi:MAG: long-chain fatty acid--CoA ligase [Deltaproteobacteria bacterium]|nr:long-chain fatty acid--CoA ligase [Deltaproteobacteria bacterium]
MQPLEVISARAVSDGNKKAFAFLKLGGKEFSDFQTLTWMEVYKKTLQYGEFLRGLSQLRRGDRIAIIAKNGPEWVLADIAAMASGFVTVPLSTQATLTELQFCLSEAGVKVVFCDQKNTELDSGILQITFAELETGILGLDGNFAPSPLAIDEMNTLIYTSGTNGQPKGVMHSMLAFSNAYQAIYRTFQIKFSDVFLSYLPLSHVAERILIEFTGIYSGATIYFVDQIEKVVHQLPKVRPTIFLAVPRVWDTMRFRIEREFAQNPILEKRLSHVPGFLRRFILSKFLKKKLGFDRARILVSGAAKLSLETIETFSRFGIQICEAYGLTETLGVTSMNIPKQLHRGSVGKACPGVFLRLMPDGEICIKSSFLFLGYYKRPQETAEALQNGWFHSGDIGKIDAGGYLIITDRKKNIFKTLHGKYVAPLPIEISFKNHPAIREILVIGESRPHCVALASVDEKNLDEKMLSTLLERINSRLAPHEQIKSLGCISSSWETSSGEMTASMKLKRRVVLEKYQQQIEDLYSSRSRVKFFTPNANEVKKMEKEKIADTRFQ